MKKNLLYVIFMLGCFTLKAQRDVQISQHIFNRTYYNPAATGASDYLNAFLLTRIQWVGWEGSPNTQIASVHSYFPKLKSGMGINLINDKTGFEQFTSVKFMYAYHMIINSNSYLSMGLNGGFFYQAINYNEQNPTDRDDPNLIWEREQKFNPDFDFGLEYNRPKFRSGISVSHLTKKNTEDTPLTPGMHFYGYLKYDFLVGVGWTLTPSFFAQNSKKSTHLEVGLLSLYRQKLWLGGYLRADEKMESESLVFMAGIEILKNLRLGYCFDLNINHLKTYTHNSHEIFLSYRLKLKNHGYDKTPRFFE